MIKKLKLKNTSNNESQNLEENIEKKIQPFSYKSETQSLIKIPNNHKKISRNNVSKKESNNDEINILGTFNKVNQLNKLATINNTFERNDSNFKKLDSKYFKKIKNSENKKSGDLTKSKLPKIPKIKTINKSHNYNFPDENRKTDNILKSFHNYKLEVNKSIENKTMINSNLAQKTSIVPSDNKINLMKHKLSKNSKNYLEYFDALDNDYYDNIIKRYSNVNNTIAKKEEKQDKNQINKNSLSSLKLLPRNINTQTIENNQQLPSPQRIPMTNKAKVEENENQANTTSKRETAALEIKKLQHEEVNEKPAKSAKKTNFLAKFKNKKKNSKLMKEKEKEVGNLNFMNLITKNEPKNELVIESTKNRVENVYFLN